MTVLCPYRDDEEVARLAYTASVENRVELEAPDEHRGGRKLDAHAEADRHIGTGLASCHPAKRVVA